MSKPGPVSSQHLIRVLRFVRGNVTKERRKPLHENYTSREELCPLHHRIYSAKLGILFLKFAYIYIYTLLKSDSGQLYNPDH